MSSIDQLSISQLKQLRETNQGNPAMVEYLDNKILAAEANSMAQPTLGVGDLARAVGQGAWSMGDEIEAGLRTGFGFAGDYDATKSQINSEIAQAYDSNPVAMNAVEFGSGFLIPGGNIAKGFKLADKGLDALNSARTIKDATKIGAINGAANGAIDGFGASTLSEDGGLGTLLNMGGGAGIGTGFGTLLGAGLPALTRAFRGSRDPEAILRQVVAETGLTAKEINARLEDLGPEATLADAFPVLRQTAQGSVGIGGATDSVGALAERNAKASGRLASEVTEETGSTINTARERTTALEAERSRVANEDYRPLDETMFSTSEAQDLLDSPLAERYLNDAIKAYASDPKNNISYKALKAMMAGDPENDIPGMIPARILANARSAMGEKASDLSAKGQNTEARSLGIVADQYGGFLDQVPGYTQANANFSRASTNIDAIAEGRTIAQNSNRFGDDKARLEDLSQTDPQARGALAVGAQSDLINDLMVSGGNRQTGSATSRLGPFEQQRLRLEAARVPQMEQSIARENDFYDTFMQVDPKMGSKTAGAQAAKDQLTQTSGVLNMVGGVMNPTEVVTKHIAEKFKLTNEGVARQLTDILLRQGMSPDEVIKMLSTQQGMTELSEYLAKVGGRNAGLTGGILSVISE
jgi:hypothetical protein